MQRIGNLKEKFLSFGNIYNAFQKAYRGTKNYSAYKFAFSADTEILKLQKELAEENYFPGTYRYFKIIEPKERVISVSTFRDRVVHHALNNILEPIYETRFIFDSYATRKEKGTHKAIKRVQNFLQKNRWYLKMDIRSYFVSINHEILNKILSGKIKDLFILNLCGKIIAKGGNGENGLPIGNLTSQFFANVYLDIFDHFIKDKLRIKYYLRYMDDFCIFSKDKNKLKQLRNEINLFLKNKLQLDLKDKATLINNRIHGLPYLGVRIYPKIIRLKKENFKRSYNKLKTRAWEYKNAYINYNKYNSSMQSLISHLNYYGINLLKDKLYIGSVSKAVLTV